MNKNIRLCLVGACLSLSPFVFAQNGARVYENSGKFSYCPPSGWNATEFPGLKYKIVFGPTEGNFTANINFVDESYNGSLQSYIDDNLAQLESILPSHELVNRSVFRTNSGITGERVIIKNVQYGFLLRQVFYFFPAPNNTYFVITCSVLDNAAESYLPVFDESIKTFELTR